ncbi:MAG: AI-2E family transporter, partial [Actinobacteria bacterium]
MSAPPLPVQETHAAPLHFRQGESLRAEDDASKAVPWILRVSAAVSWRMIAVAIVAVGLAWGAMKISFIIIPVAVALLAAVLLNPFVAWLHRVLHLPKAAAAGVGLLLALLFVALILSQAVVGIIQQVPRLLRSATDGVEQMTTWLSTNPFGIDMTVAERTLGTLQAEVTTWLQANSSTLASGAVSFTSSIFSILASTLIMLFCLFFFLKEGRQIWLWIVRLFPEPAREPLHESAIRGWVTLGGYVKTQIKVAAIDAVGIGLGAYFLGVPMALP